MAATKIIDEEAFVNFYSICARETYGNFTRQLGKLAMGYKLQSGHFKRTDASLYEAEDSERVYNASIGLLKAIKWAGKHNNGHLLTKQQINWEEDDIIGIERLALEIYTDVVTNEELIKAIEERR